MKKFIKNIFGILAILSFLVASYFFIEFKINYRNFYDYPQYPLNKNNLNATISFPNEKNKSCIFVIRHQEEGIRATEKEIISLIDNIIIANKDSGEIVLCEKRQILNDLCKFYIKNCYTEKKEIEVSINENYFNGSDNFDSFIIGSVVDGKDPSLMEVAFDKLFSIFFLALSTILALICFFINPCSNQQ